ncbi:MAG: glutaredoxin [Dokdonia donghaensis]|jgi:glutaredoxin
MVFFAKAQNTSTPDVELIEQKQPKRWLLYAQNNTDQEQEAFLIVQGEGFRRSADRPVIKKIPPNEKVLMITLIPLRGATPTYTKIFNYNNKLQFISKRKGEDDEAYVNIRPIKASEFTVFTKDNCDKCEVLINYLNDNHLKYRTLVVSKHKKVTDFMFKHLKGDGHNGGKVGLPVIMHKGKKSYDIKDIDAFINSYDWSSLK